MSEPDAAPEPSFAALGLLDHLEHSPPRTGVTPETDDPFATREGQLGRLLSATGEVVGGELQPEIALKRLSDAAQRYVPHSLVDIGWLEDGGTYCSLQQIASLPEEERPGELETIERSGLAGVLVDGQPLLIDDLQSETWRERLSPKKLRQAAQAGARAAVIVPLRLGQRITGMLEFQHEQPGAYDEQSVVAASTIASQIAPVVEALHLYKREEIVRRQLETIFEISQAISASLDLEETLPVLGRSLTRALALPACAIYLYDEARRALVPRAAYGGVYDDTHDHPHLDFAAIRRAFFEYAFPIDEPYGAHLSQLRQPLVIDNPRESPYLPADFVRDIPFAAVMEVPLVVRDRLVGLGVVGERNLVAVAAGQQQTGRERSRGHQKPNGKARNQTEAPHPPGNVGNPNVGNPNIRVIALKPLIKILPVALVRRNPNRPFRKGSKQPWSIELKQAAHGLIAAKSVARRQDVAAI